jgi:hypothetical protein
MDNLLNFLNGLQKLEQRAKKFIELHWRILKTFPSLVAVACYLPDQAKYLTVTPRTKRQIFKTFTVHYSGFINKSNKEEENAAFFRVFSLSVTKTKRTNSSKGEQPTLEF